LEGRRQPFEARRQPFEARRQPFEGPQHPFEARRQPFEGPQRGHFIDSVTHLGIGVPFALTEPMK
jgi:hypothetical protein